MSIIFGYHYQTIVYMVGDLPTKHFTEVECLDPEVVIYRDLVFRLENAFKPIGEFLEIADLEITRTVPSLLTRNNVQIRHTGFIVKRNSQCLELSYVRMNKDCFKIIGCNKHYVSKYFVVSASSQKALDSLLLMISLML